MTAHTVLAEVPRPVTIPDRPEAAPARAPNGRPYVIGHRGSPRHHPENSWDGIRAALDAGADGVEFDVRRAGDGVPVVCHDADLRRTHRENVPLAALPAAMLPVPTLASMLAAIAHHHPDRLVDIELKEPVAPDHLAAILADAGWRGRTVITSFEIATVRTYADHGGWTVGLLEEDRRLSPQDGVSRLELTGADFLGIKNPVFLKSLAQEVHDAGGGLWLWTLNRGAQMQRALRYQADAIITDVPDRGAALVRGRAEPTGDATGVAL